MTCNAEYAATAGEFVGQRAGCAIAGRSPSWLLRMAMLGRIRVRMEPGEPPRYRREDIELLGGVTPR